MNRLTSILTQTTAPKKPSGSIRVSLTPSGEAILDADKLHTYHPSWYEAVSFLVNHGRTPEQVAHDVAASGADDTLSQQCASAARHLAAQSPDRR